MKYIFARNINNTPDEGIVNLETNEIVCLCTQFNSVAMLDKLNKADEKRKITGSVEGFLKSKGVKDLELNAYGKLTKHGYYKKYLLTDLLSEYATIIKNERPTK